MVNTQRFYACGDVENLSRFFKLPFPQYAGLIIMFINYMNYS